MIRPSDKALRAMIALEDDNAFKDLVDWLSEQSVLSALDSIMVKDEIPMRWTQGEAQAFIELKKVIKDARKLITLRETARERPNGKT